MCDENCRESTRCKLSRLLTASLEILGGPTVLDPKDPSRVFVVGKWMRFASQGHMMMHCTFLEP